jgi:hypothetical protein
MHLLKAFHSVGIALSGVALLVGCGRLTTHAGAARADDGGFEERFDAARLDESVWRLTRKNDFQESTVEVIDVTVQRVGQGLKVLENGGKMFATDHLPWPFPTAYLYLQMSSHSNYPPREIYFDNVVIHPRPF